MAIVERGGWRYNAENEHLLGDLFGISESASRAEVVTILEGSADYSGMVGNQAPGKSPALDTGSRNTPAAKKMREIFDRILRGQKISLDEFRQVHLLAEKLSDGKETGKVGEAAVATLWEAFDQEPSRGSSDGRAVQQLAEALDLPLTIHKPASGDALSDLFTAFTS